MMAIRIHAMRRGGQVTIVSSAGEHSVTLAKRRFLLVAALLAPPAPYQAGDYVPDYILVPLVWTKDEVVGRENINVLLHRVRHDLAAAGRPIQARHVAFAERELPRCSPADRHDIDVVEPPFPVVHQV